MTRAGGICDTEPRTGLETFSEEQICVAIRIEKEKEYEHNKE